jgi:hypothetical protein
VSNIPSSVTERKVIWNYDLQDYIIVSGETYPVTTFNGNGYLKEISIPDVTFTDGVFSGCTSLETVRVKSKIIPGGVLKIGGLSAGDLFSVYNIQGILIYKGTALASIRMVFIEAIQQQKQAHTYPLHPLISLMNVKYTPSQCFFIVFQ